ncbi:hypothetical protein LJR235_001396 [Pararhizobium sp. LjRoot235]|uniref:hypothetical protein n=1 Tax=Pararhizobium sp. LjRoot235 TaxID=3342291 RepID=UPI003ECEBAD3
MNDTLETSTLSVDDAINGAVIFGKAPDESRQAALGSRLDFYRQERDLVRSYVDALDDDVVVITSAEGAADNTFGLAHLTSVLLNYATLMSERMGELEVELKILDGTLACCEDEDCACVTSTI